MHPATSIQTYVRQFCSEIVDLLREEVRAEFLQEVQDRIVLGQPPVPPLPRRKAVYLGKATPLKSSSLATNSERVVLDTLYKAEAPLSSSEMSYRMGRAESTVRGQLGRLVKKNLVRRQVTKDKRVTYEVLPEPITLR